jgi:ribosomal protein L7/L12
MREFHGFSPVYGLAAATISRPATPSSAFSGTLPGFQITGNKINDVKTIRSLTGLGLKEGKEIVEKIYEAQEKAKYAILDATIRTMFETANRDGFSDAEIRQRLNTAFEGRR